MKPLMKACLFSAMLTLPITASAQSDVAPKTQGPGAASMMNCPMMADMRGMQKDLGAMMSDVDGMMKNAKDATTKDNLQKMHSHMAAMMANMQMMANMMGRTTTQGAQQPNNSTPAAPENPPVAPQDHEAHHPEK